MKRSVWVLVGQRRTADHALFLPTIRGVYFSKQDGEKRIEYLKRTTGGKFTYWLIKTPFFTSSKFEND